MKRKFIVFLYKIAYHLAQIYYYIFRPITMGVKVMLVRDDEVLLVRHSYQPGWFLPGGGVKRSETLVEAIHREAREELGATLHALEMVNIFSNNRERRSDHVVIFRSDDFTLSDKQDIEIDEAKFFPTVALPDGTSMGTSHQIQKYLVRGERSNLPDSW